MIEKSSPTASSLCINTNVLLVISPTLVIHVSKGIFGEISTCQWNASRRCWTSLPRDRLRHAVYSHNMLLLALALFLTIQNAWPVLLKPNYRHITSTINRFVCQRLTYYSWFQNDTSFPTWSSHLSESDLWNDNQRFSKLLPTNFACIYLASKPSNSSLFISV